MTILNQKIKNMKNIIVVDVDTDRTPVIQIGKMEGSELPKNQEEAKDVILKDMACLTEGLCTLILAADQSNIKTIEESMKDVITHLERGVSTGEVKVSDKTETLDNEEE